jgi:hypothetical protein
MNGFLQEKPKYSEKTYPDATLSTTNPTCQTRARTRAAAVRSQRLTASAMVLLIYHGSSNQNCNLGPEASHFSMIFCKILLSFPDKFYYNTLKETTPMSYRSLTAASK